MSRPARDPQSRLCMCGTMLHQSSRWRRSLHWCSGAGSSTPRRARYATPCWPSSTSAPCAPSLMRGYALAPSLLPRLSCRTLHLGSLSRWPCYSREQVWIGRDAFCQHLSQVHASESVSAPQVQAGSRESRVQLESDLPRASLPLPRQCAHLCVYTLHVSTCQSRRKNRERSPGNTARTRRGRELWRGGESAGEAIVTREREGHLPTRGKEGRERGRRVSRRPRGRARPPTRTRTAAA
mmetsp:Transcript_33541/g.111949  ORF Transcript_33541/g.111949 Transcript_33541/m.111949 type:complete len:238 (+) Transcript_33541:116-829(+)